MSCCAARSDGKPATPARQPLRRGRLFPAGPDLWACYISHNSGNSVGERPANHPNGPLSHACGVHRGRLSGGWPHSRVGHMSPRDSARETRAAGAGAPERVAPERGPERRVSDSGCWVPNGLHPPASARGWERLDPGGSAHAVGHTGGSGRFRPFVTCLGYDEHAVATKDAAPRSSHRNGLPCGWRSGTRGTGDNDPPAAPQGPFQRHAPLWGLYKSDQAVKVASAPPGRVARTESLPAEHG